LLYTETQEKEVKYEDEKSQKNIRNSVKICRNDIKTHTHAQNKCFANHVRAVLYLFINQSINQSIYIAP